MPLILYFKCCWRPPKRIFKHIDFDDLKFSAAFTDQNSVLEDLMKVPQRITIFYIFEILQNFSPITIQKIMSKFWIDIVDVKG